MESAPVRSVHPLRKALLWCLAAVPALAAGLWVGYASHWPELPGDRLALREGLTCWQFDELLQPNDGARHLVTQALSAALAWIPGASVATIAFTTAVLAVLLSLATGSLLRRSHALQGVSGPAALAAAGLLVASPNLGLIWLYADRFGIVLPPLLLVLALGWLQNPARATLRQLGALTLLALAPFCHTHGLCVGVALLPTLLTLRDPAGTRRSAAWAATALVLLVGAGWYSMEPLTARGWSAGGGLFAVLPLAAFARDLCLQAGIQWLDLLPSTDLDELALGATSWLLPLLLLCVGDRSPAARARASAWWSCLLFGLCLVLWNVLRYDTEPPVGRWREALFGGFLLPLGLIGVLAARFGDSVLRVAFGALLVLGAQDWYIGIEDVRIGSAIVQQQAIRAQLPAAWAALLPQQREGWSPAAQEALRARGLVPAVPAQLDEALVAAFERALVTERNDSEPVATGPTLRGEVRGSLRQPAPPLVLMVARQGSGAPQVLAAVAPDFRAHGRTVLYDIRMPEAAGKALGGAADTTVCLLGVHADGLRLLPLSRGFVLRDGVLTAASRPR